jgi:hypothetical protein
LTGIAGFKLVPLLVRRAAAFCFRGLLASHRGRGAGRRRVRRKSETSQFLFANLKRMRRLVKAARAGSSPHRPTRPNVCFAGVKAPPDQTLASAEFPSLPEHFRPGDRRRASRGHPGQVRGARLTPANRLVPPDIEKLFGQPANPRGVAPRISSGGSIIRAMPSRFHPGGARADRERRRATHASETIKTRE